MSFADQIRECNLVRLVGQVKNPSDEPTLPILVVKTQKRERKIIFCPSLALQAWRKESNIQSRGKRSKILCLF